MHKKELVMNKPHTHMLDVATESSINSLLIHTVAWLENTCNNSYNGFLKRQHLRTKYKIINDVFVERVRNKSTEKIQDPGEI